MRGFHAIVVRRVFRRGLRGEHFPGVVLAEQAGKESRGQQSRHAEHRHEKAEREEEREAQPRLLSRCAGHEHHEQQAREDAGHEVRAEVRSKLPVAGTEPQQHPKAERLESGGQQPEAIAVHRGPRAGA